MSGALQIESLEVRNGAFRLGPIDIHLPAGGHAVVLGPSGAGKSTLLGGLAGALAASGSARLGGLDLLALPPEQRRVGFVPQGGLLFPHLSVAENVGWGVPRGERAKVVPGMLEAVGAGGLARRDPRSLSGGETMRVALARALAPGPRLLLLDEPLAGLDPGGREELLRLLLALPERTGGAPILQVTHDFDEAFRLASTLAVLLGGRVVAAGPPAEIFARPPSAEVAGFVGVDNVLAGRFEEAGLGRSLFRCGALALLVAGRFEGPGHLAFDGAALVPTASPPRPAPGRNLVVAEVESLSPLQRGHLVTLRSGGVVLRARTRAATGLVPGATVAFLLDADAPHAIPRRGP